MHRASGWTILEMIVAASIVSVLAMLTIPAFGSIQRFGEDAKCTSNLRQIGLGILAYANDHNGYLPGPLNSSQYPYWDHYSQLAKHIADYIALDKRRYKERDDVFVCPAYKRVLKSMGKKVGESPVYFVNIEVPINNGAQFVTPFGYANAQNYATFGTWANFPPMNLATLSDISDEKGSAQSRIWMLKDIDQRSPLRSFMSFGIQKILPPKMVHKTHRNALYFDMHVAPTDFSHSNPN